MKNFLHGFVCLTTNQKLLTVFNTQTFLFPSPSPHFPFLSYPPLRVKVYFSTAVCEFRVIGQQEFSHPPIEIELLFHFVPLGIILLSISAPQTFLRSDHAAEWFFHYFGRGIILRQRFCLTSESEVPIAFFSCSNFSVNLACDGSVPHKHMSQVQAVVNTNSWRCTNIDER